MVLVIVIGDTRSLDYGSYSLLKAGSSLSRAPILASMFVLGKVWNTVICIYNSPAMLLEPETLKPEPRLGPLNVNLT